MGRFGCRSHRGEPPKAARHFWRWSWQSRSPPVVRAWAASRSPVPGRCSSSRLKTPRIRSNVASRASRTCAAPTSPHSMSGSSSTPRFRLDRPQDLHRLHLTLASQRPKLLILDPFVRLQRADENDARQVAAILASLRELAPTFNAAVLPRPPCPPRAAPPFPAQALRGSGDFWAWGDSNLYLSGRPNRLRLTVEHRARTSASASVAPSAGHRSPPRWPTPSGSP